MKTRHPQFADAPPIADSGLPGFEFNSWFAILAPAGTPKEITHKLSAEVVKALADPDVREKLNLQGLTPRGSTPEELGAMTKSQLERYGKLIRDAGIKAE
jgi:tripartite-type tricarboxylate transporter receptor subunit TctC